MDRFDRHPVFNTGFYIYGQFIMHKREGRLALAYDLVYKKLDIVEVMHIR